ncbi:B-cell receptor CD22-like [Channa argus]|uniref:B-cell receptor CD22-like n=1 Tax=Channa argus TaxID=215402 RepID=UPI003520F65D
MYFTSISSWDSGTYDCKSENQYGQIFSSSIFIDVQYPPKLPSVSVSPSAEIVEGSSVNLTCSTDANPAANYTWYKENEDSPKASGQIFTITDFRPEHSGNYYCETQNTRGRHHSTLHLIVLAGSRKSAAPGLITAIILVVTFLSAFLFIRKKCSCKQLSGPGESPRKIAQQNVGPEYDTVHREPAVQQEDLVYTTVTFSTIQEDPLYSNIRTVQLNRVEEEDVDYTVVKN